MLITRPLDIRQRFCLLGTAAMAGIFTVAWPGGPLQAAPACTEAAQNGCVELSATPVQDTVAIPPNIVLILDDSGSMQWNYMPDSGYLNYNATYLRNAGNNKVYYDPTVEYTAPPKADGTYYTNYSYDNGYRITNIPLSGVNTGWGSDDITRHAGSQRNYGNSFAFYTSETTGTGSNKKTYYYFTFAVGPADATQTVYYVASQAQGCRSGKANCVTEDAMGDGTYAPPGVRVGTNVANWFAYYRNRILMAKSGLMTAFSDLSPNYRFGFGAINNTNSGKLPGTKYKYSSYAMEIAQVQPFGDGSNTSSQKAKFWAWLESMDPNGSTPLRRALASAGEYYKTAQPWQAMPGDPDYVSGSNNAGELACRASYTILTTDGFWNGSNPGIVTSGATDVGGTTYTNPDGSASGQYDAVEPFKGGTVSGGASLADVAATYWKTDLRPADNLVPASRRDPAFWQHMTTFTFGIGFEPVESKNGSLLPMDKIWKWADDGGGTGSTFVIPGFSWPTPSSDNVTNIADLAHAAVVGHGDFFSATNPQELADGFAKAIAQISERNVAPQPRARNASIDVTGALSFSTSYNTGDWAGTLQAVEMNPDGTVGSVKWDMGAKLDAMPWSTRKVFSAVYNNVNCGNPAVNTGVFDKGVTFDASVASQLDCRQTAGLSSPALDVTQPNDTVQNRINYLRGDDTHEGSLYRKRSHKLGAIIKSQPVYVAYPADGYYDSWPDGPGGTAAPESNASYSQFVTTHEAREGTLYIGANDGMLHAFSAPAPNCTQDTTDPTQFNCTYATGGGVERWAYVPRAVYDNLGNLTNDGLLSDPSGNTNPHFNFRPTVDGTPRTRDVFFGGSWHTLLAGSVGLGGRGVFALDITDPQSFTANHVLWEFDADMQVSAGCKTTHGNCDATDLGYSVPQPFIGRLHNGKWVVLVSSGYFPDCSQPDVPTSEPDTGSKPVCNAIAAQAPVDTNGNPYSALFVLDAETGAMIAELKTPTNIPGVTSYGLGPAVLGDYENDQVDDVAFAGDLMGNLWRFDLSSADPGQWEVQLAYQPKDPGLQPITVMPRLFPDIWSSRFMVVFGTGKYLGAGDNSTSIPVQAAYGVRELIDESTNQLITVKYADLLSQTLSEVAGTGDLTGATLRQLSDTAIDPNANRGWRIDFDLANAPGERVVTTPGAIFPTNDVVFETLIPGASNYCDPSVKGSAMIFSVNNGGANGGLTSLGGNNIVGGRVTEAGTGGGTVPVIGKLGGGLRVGLPLEGVDPKGGPPPGPELEYNWRRRSWSVLKDDQ